MSSPPDQQPAPSLQEATIKGVRWLAVTRVVSEGFAFGAAVALARLVSPAEFGHAAIALIFYPLGVILTFEGFASALVQRPVIDDDDRRSAMLMSLLGGIVLTGLVIALDHPLWRPLFGDKTAGLVSLMSPVLAISAIGGVSRATLWRALDFGRLSMIDVASLVAGSAASVVLALQHFGGRALVLGALVQAGTSSGLLLLCAPAPRPRWNARSMRAISGFGLPAALAGLVDVLFRNLDYAIVGAHLSATQTGIYYRAFNLGVVYQDKLSRVMMQIAFPVYARTTDRAELGELHKRAARVHAAVIFPLLASLIVLAPLIVPFVFGSVWTAAVQPTQILAAAGMIAAILTGYPQVMLAIGKPRALLSFNLGAVALYAVGISLAVSHGLVAVAITVDGIYLVILLGVYRMLLARYLGIALVGLVSELGPAVTGCVALIVVGEPLRRALDPALPVPVTIAVVGLTGLGAYALALRALFPVAWADVSRIVARIVPAPGRRRPPAPSPPAAPGESSP